MCNSKKILSRSKNGILSFCNHSKLFRLVYNNLCFELYEWELEALKDYIDELDVTYWESCLKEWGHHRKIPLSVGRDHFIILLDREEVREVSLLLSPKSPALPLLHSRDINYDFLDN